MCLLLIVTSLPYLTSVLKQTSNIYSQCLDHSKDTVPMMQSVLQGNEEVTDMWALAVAQSQQFDKLVHQSREFPISCKW